MTFQPGNEHGKNYRGPRKAQSVVTVGRRLLGGRVNMNTGPGRRYRDLVKAYSQGITTIGAYEMALIKLAAGMSVQAEAMQVKILQGEILDEKKLARVANTVNRTLGTLKKIAAQQAAERPAEHSFLAQYLAGLDSAEKS
jgi:hypothetical protein